MTFRPLLYLSLLATFGAPALAQGERRTVDPKVIDAKTKQKILIEREAAEEDKRAEGLRPVVPAQQPPPGDYEHPVVEGLESYVVPIASVRPGRIAPGGAGTLYVTLAMQANSVLQAGARIELTYEAVQGPIRLGSWQIDEPGIGTLPTGFKGQPVYDNTAMLTLPISVAPGTEHRTYPVQLSLEAEVSDARTTAVRGRYRSSVRGLVTVGPPLPTPPVQLPVAEASDETAAGDPGAAGSATRGGDGTGDAAAGPVAVAAEPTPPDPSALVAGGPDVPAGGAAPVASGSSWSIALLAGVALLGLVLLLLGRRT